MRLSQFRTLAIPLKQWHRSIIKRHAWYISYSIWMSEFYMSLILLDSTSRMRMCVCWNLASDNMPWRQNAATCRARCIIQPRVLYIDFRKEFERCIFVYMCWVPWFLGTIVHVRAALPLTACCLYLIASQGYDTTCERMYIVHSSEIGPSSIIFI